MNSPFSKLGNSGRWVGRRMQAIMWELELPKIRPGKLPSSTLPGCWAESIHGTCSTSKNDGLSPLRNMGVICISHSQVGACLKIGTPKSKSNGLEWFRTNPSTHPHYLDGHATMPLNAPPCSDITQTFLSFPADFWARAPILSKLLVMLSANSLTWSSLICVYPKCIKTCTQTHGSIMAASWHGTGC